MELIKGGEFEMTKKAMLRFSNEIINMLILCILGLIMDEDGIMMHYALDLYIIMHTVFAIYKLYDNCIWYITPINLSYQNPHFIAPFFPSAKELALQYTFFSFLPILELNRIHRLFFEFHILNGFHTVWGCPKWALVGRKICCTV